MSQTPVAPVTDPVTDPVTRPRLSRSREDKMIGGVCGGLARHLDIDVTIVRVVAAVGLVLGFPWFGFLYLVAWAVMPQDRTQVR